MKKSAMVLLSILSVLIILIGCSDLGLNSPSGYTISGKVIDFITGDGVSGAKVGFGQNIVTTDFNGNYSFTLAENEKITGNFYVCKGLEYQFLVFSGLNITLDSDINYNIKVRSASGGGMLTHTVSGQFFYSNGTTQIPNDSEVFITIITENGGWYKVSFDYDTTTGYSIDTAAFGADCSLFIEVGDSIPFFYYLENVDLSASTVSLDLTKPSTGFSTVTVTGVYDDYFNGTMVYSDSINIDLRRYSIDAATTKDIEIYNPDGKEFFWKTFIDAIDIPSQNDSTEWQKVSAPSVPGSAVTLPVPTLAAPTAAVLGSSITYQSGLLSFTGNAESYIFPLKPHLDGLQGSIVSLTSSVDFPDDIVALIESISDPYVSWDASVKPMNSSPDMDLSQFLLMISLDSMPETECAFIRGESPASDNLIPSN